MEMEDIELSEALRLGVIFRQAGAILCPSADGRQQIVVYEGLGVRDSS